MPHPKSDSITLGGVVRLARLAQAQPIRHAHALVLTTLFAFGCARARAADEAGLLDPGLRTRAAYDLQCPRNAIAKHGLGAGASIVTGCGKEAVYVEQCAACSYVDSYEHLKNYPCQCTYSRNGEIHARTVPVAAE
jgi:hypothetical protein